MTHLEQELQSLKTDSLQMLELVLQQLRKAHQTIEKFDADIILDVKHVEKRIDAFELKIAMDCENALALFSPVAVDLRFILSVLKMATSIERLGDYAKSMVSLINRFEQPVQAELIAKTQVMNMFATCENMLVIVIEAFETDNSALARKPLLLDEDIDLIDRNANIVIAQWIREHPEDVVNALTMFEILKRLERFGDQVKNITLEIIFHLEAKMLKHHKKQLKKEKEMMRGTQND